jgi:clan AA aspartic protease (TIGR02281 family)
LPTRALALAALAAALVTAPARAEWTSAGGGEVPIDGNGTSWLVRATVNGKVTGLFLIDTGATYCVLAPSTAKRLGLQPGPEAAEMRTANGTVQVPVVHLKTLEVGNNRAHDVTAVVHDTLDSPIDGIIGLSYLNNYSYAIDPKRRVLKLH